MAGIVGKICGLYRSFKDKNVVTLAASVSSFGFMSFFPFLVLLASVTSFEGAFAVTGVTGSAA
jgi:uncharacterized BrkB/YihY/UPF0761 family membrane protein